MDVTSILKEIPLKKLLALCALGVLLPQAIPLLTRLVWAIFIILIILLLIEICVIFVIKAWCPNSVSTNHVIAWTIKTFMTLGSSAFNIVLLLIYSSFDLVFGRSFLGTHRARSSRSNRADLREHAPSKIASEKLRLFSRDGYTPLARRAITNSATKPRNPRFSL